MDLGRMHPHAKPADLEGMSARLENVEAVLASLDFRRLRALLARSGPAGAADLSRNSADTGHGAASPYLDAVDAAEYLGVTVKSLYGVVERGHLVPLRGPKRRYRFTVEMLDEYLSRARGR